MIFDNNKYYAPVKSKFLCDLKELFGDSLDNAFWLTHGGDFQEFYLIHTPCSLEESNDDELSDGNDIVFSFKTGHSVVFSSDADINHIASIYMNPIDLSKCIKSEHYHYEDNNNIK